MTAAVHSRARISPGGDGPPLTNRRSSESRVKPTSRLAKLWRACERSQQVLVCASAIGIYGGRGDEELTEDSLPGSGFLPERVPRLGRGSPAGRGSGDPGSASALWRGAFARGGALAQMLPVFRAGPGRTAGQRPSVDQLDRAPRCDPGNRVCVGNRECLRTGQCSCAQPGDQPGVHPFAGSGRFTARQCCAVPAFALRVAFGEMAEATILQSERVVPARLSAAGFDFEYPELDAAFCARICCHGKNDLGLESMHRKLLVCSLCRSMLLCAGDDWLRSARRTGAPEPQSADAGGESLRRADRRLRSLGLGDADQDHGPSRPSAPSKAQICRGVERARAPISAASA